MITSLGVKRLLPNAYSASGSAKILRNKPTTPLALLLISRPQPQVVFHCYLSTDSKTPHFENRHEGIIVHPDSIGSKILPGNFVLRTRKDGTTKKRYTELVYGYFWHLKDLRRCEEKPVLANDALIPEDVAKDFPLLECKTLAGEKVEVPEFFLRKNRSKDAAAQCTLVAVSFRDYGYQLLSSWIDPLVERLDSDRFDVYKINVSEGWLNKWLLRGVIQALVKRNTPVSQHDNTLLFFGDNEAFRDSLRMHNIMTGYVFLIDGVGRVRFAASGPATTQELDKLVGFAEELLFVRPEAKRSVPQKGRRKYRK